MENKCTFYIYGQCKGEKPEDCKLIKAAKDFSSVGGVQTKNMITTSEYRVSGPIFVRRDWHKKDMEWRRAIAKCPFRNNLYDLLTDLGQEKNVRGELVGL